VNPYKRGLSSVAKMGVVIVIAILVLAGIYLAPSFLGSNKVKTGTPAGGDTHTFGLLQLFKYFSQMQLRSAIYNPSGSGGSIQVETLSYVVLGNSSFEGTRNTRVEFSTNGGGRVIVAWFNSSGIVDRLDVLGDTNYTGPASAILAQTYTNTFSLITTTTNNATLFSLLSKVSENTTSIGPTQLDVSTYHLAAQNPTYKSITADYATIPGTFQRLAVYVDEKMNDGVENTFQVLSLQSSS
jgi:hypothetical protein